MALPCPAPGEVPELLSVPGLQVDVAPARDLPSTEAVLEGGAVLRVPRAPDASQCHVEFASVAGHITRATAPLHRPPHRARSTVRGPPDVLPRWPSAQVAPTTATRPREPPRGLQHRSLPLPRSAPVARGLQHKSLPPPHSAPVAHGDLHHRSRPPLPPAPIDLRCPATLLAPTTAPRSLGPVPFSAGRSHRCAPHFTGSMTFSTNGSHRRAPHFTGSMTFSTDGSHRRAPPFAGSMTFSTDGSHRRAPHFAGPMTFSASRSHRRGSLPRSPVVVRNLAGWIRSWATAFTRLPLQRPCAAHGTHGPKPQRDGGLGAARGTTSTRTTPSVHPGSTWPTATSLHLTVAPDSTRTTRTREPLARLRVPRGTGSGGFRRPPASCAGAAATRARRQATRLPRGTCGRGPSPHGPTSCRLPEGWTPSATILVNGAAACRHVLAASEVDLTDEQQPPSLSSAFQVDLPNASANGGITRRHQDRMRPDTRAAASEPSSTWNAGSDSRADG